MVRNTVPAPGFYPSFQLVEKLGKTMIQHYCYQTAISKYVERMPRYVDLDFTGNCPYCGKSYAFEALKKSIC